jgi:hypothetical protein
MNHVNSFRYVLDVLIISFTAGIGWSLGTWLFGKVKR